LGPSKMLFLAGANARWPSPLTPYGRTWAAINGIYGQAPDEQKRPRRSPSRDCLAMTARQMTSRFTPFRDPSFGGAPGRDDLRQTKRFHRVRLPAGLATRGSGADD
jgi:hypothetical protein